MRQAITDVPGIKVGHWTNKEAATGCTVVLCEEEAVGGVDVRGSAPGTRETDILRPTSSVSEVHAVLLSGGSAFGLEAAGGVMRYLEERGYGHKTKAGKVPIVPAAILFDLALGNSKIRPGPEEGYKACLEAKSSKVAEGSVGAGTGATVAKILGIEKAVKGGIGMASRKTKQGIIVGALVAVNAFGDIVNPKNGKVIAGPRREDNRGFLRTSELLQESGELAPPITSTIIGVVATNALLNKAELNKLAALSYNGLAQCISPAHTMFDGDVIFALSLGKEKADLDLLGWLAAEVIIEAILRGVNLAEGLHGIPGVKELNFKR